MLLSNVQYSINYSHHAVNYTTMKEMATHSSVLAWRIPGTGEPGGLSMTPYVYGVAKGQTRLKRLSSSSSRLIL